MTALAPGATAIVDHSLVDDPLLSLDALADAADRLTATNVTQRRADVPRIAPERRYSRLDRPPGEVVRRITTSPSWIMLGSLATLPEYAALLRRTVGQFELMLRARGERILAEDLHVFVAGPGTTVPVHFDRDHHLLMQIQGWKTVGTGTYTDPRVAQLQVERSLGPGRPRPEVHPDSCETHVLHPGQALVMPAYTFHWVENGDDVSIALTCLARTERTARDAAVHRFNLWWRRFGLRPAPPGRRLRVDRAKQRAVAACSRMRPKTGTVQPDLETDDGEEAL
jgi:hypothetical protein